MSHEARIMVGTSGWSYEHWDGAFYPPDMPAGQRLALYAGHFPTVEVNASFYRLPSQAAVRSWREAAPNHFRFSFKGSRTITHFHRLRGVSGQIETFMARLAPLGSFLDVVLWQLPPTLERDDERLDAFLGMLPRSRARHAIEFRHTSWLAEDIFAILRAHKAAHVHVSSSEMPRDLTVTSDFVYVRMHGLAEHRHDYDRAQLATWAEFLREQTAQGRGGYVYFNNDAEARAPANARLLVEMLGDAAARWPRR